MAFSADAYDGVLEHLSLMTPYGRTAAQIHLSLLKLSVIEYEVVVTQHER